jgi:hypothetical protein
VSLSIPANPTQPSGQTSLAAATIIIAFAATIRFLRYFLWPVAYRLEEHQLRVSAVTFFPAAINFVPIPVGIAILSVFFYCITYLKSMIPAVIPYWADAPFYRSIAPFSSITQGIVNRDRARLACHWAFSMAFGISFTSAALSGCCTGKGTARLATSLASCWLVNRMMFAYLFSSMGPIFHGTVRCLSCAPP